MTLNSLFSTNLLKMKMVTTKKKNLRTTFRCSTWHEVFQICQRYLLLLDFASSTNVSLHLLHITLDPTGALVGHLIVSEPRPDEPRDTSRWMAVEFSLKTSTAKTEICLRQVTDCYGSKQTLKAQTRGLLLLSARHLATAPCSTIFELASNLPKP